MEPIYEGYGKMTKKNGDKYEGNFKNYKFNGQGKLTYKNKIENTSADILIYNIKDEEYIKRDDKRKVDMPFYIVTILLILKILYYQVGILPKHWYEYLKRTLMDIMDDGVNFLKIKSSTWKFLIFEIPKKRLEEVI